MALLPWAWMGAFVALPFALIVGVSLSTPELAVPPYSLALVKTADGWRFTPDWAAYARLADELFAARADALYLPAWGHSLALAAATTLLCLGVGYPFAYRIARADARVRQTLLLLVMLPFWTSLLLRVYAWMGLLDSSEAGLVNRLLLHLGLVEQPLQLLYTRGAVLVGMVYSYLPFMVLPLYANLVKLDGRLLDAAHDLGAGAWTTFIAVTLPLSVRGIVAGSMLVFIPAVGEFVIPDLLGGGGFAMIGRRIWDDFGPNQDWPMAAAAAVVMVAALVVPIVALVRHGRQVQVRA